VPILTAPQPLPAVLLDNLKAHKPAGLLAQPPPAAGLGDQRTKDTRHLLTPAALSEIPPDDASLPRIRVTIVGKGGLWSSSGGWRSSAGPPPRLGSSDSDFPRPPRPPMFSDVGSCGSSSGSP
jgi:hypothetical protein